jgi:hypothetical protein
MSKNSQILEKSQQLYTNNSLKERKLKGKGLYFKQNPCLIRIGLSS